MLITRVWQDQPGKYFCISTKSRQGKWKDHFFARSQFKQVPTFIKNNIDKDLYWCPHGFIQRRRLKDYAEMPHLLWADLDEADPSSMTPMPTIAWQSSPNRFCGIWLVDEPIDESLNRRLTYHVGADHGGWDVTQVLRIPGTYNYKYKNKPRVKRLWEDGPSFTIKEIEGILPNDPKASEPVFGDAHKIYKRYQKRLSRFARREILNGKPSPGKRSEVIWRLNKEMLEAGMTTDEAFALLWVSPWNKFKDRKNGERQLRRELDKAVSEKLESVTVNVSEEDAIGFQVKSMAEIKEETLDWIWYPFLAKSELTILEGDPGLGKSYLAQIVGAAICDGKRLPRVKPQKSVKGKVVYFDMENSAGSVTKRRLVDNNCKNLNRYFQVESTFQIDDEEALEKVYETLSEHRPKLVVFDTLNMYIGKADTHKASETAQAMSHFVEIARRFNCAVLVLRHLTKSSKEKALYRGQGSIATAGAARVVMTVGVHPEEPDTRVMSITKINVAKRPKALTFTIESLADTLKFKDRSEFVWGEWVDLTSDDIVSAGPAIRQVGDVVKEAGQFLRDLLEDGPQTRQDIGRAADARGINRKQLERAFREQLIVRKQTGTRKNVRVTWELPPINDDDDE